MDDTLLFHLLNHYIIMMLSTMIMPGNYSIDNGNDLQKPQ